MPKGRKKITTTKPTRRTRATKTVAVRAAAKSPAKTPFRWVESYTSFLMGIVVVIVAALFIFSFIKQTHQPKQQTTSTNTATVTPQPPRVTQAMFAPQKKTYTVKGGDDLWNIAETVYHSGYNWVDIARANHLVNPGTIHAGNVLVLPSITPEQKTISPTPVIISIAQQQVPNPIVTTTYTVQKGDDLWNIAVRAYGDGYKWTSIAEVNHLANPGLIFSGNVLQIPR